MVGNNQEFIMGACEVTHILKGKRTKRLRPASSTTSCSGGDNNNNISNHRTPSPCSSVEFADEEDMANCLILLAQGNQTPQLPTTATATAGSKVYVYQCKTCNRCFPSFQALGGHRASHKKPRLPATPANVDEEKKPFSVVMAEEARHQDRIHEMNTTLSLQIVNRVSLCTTNMKSTNKIHECSICGAEFSSGQALGGHMRRHRAFAANSITTPSSTTTTTSANLARSSPELSQESSKKPRNSLQLDLNLPAPQEDHDLLHQEAKLIHKEAVLPNLIDCHY